MANKKFSQFDLKTNSADVQFVVGYNGTDNVRIAPSDLGGGGASDLNGLSDCLVDTDSLYVGESPSSLSGNPQGNTSLGIDAANALTSGTNNTFIGNDAGLTATTANDNVLIGYQAGKAITNTTKQNNVCIGSGTFDVIAGQNSVVVGYQAGRVSSSTSSVYVGYQSGWGCSGASNTGVGYLALNGGSGAKSTGLGHRTAGSNTAEGHISVGYNAGYSQTSGVKNTNIGYQAGYAQTTGFHNTTLGYEAGKSLTTGDRNVLIGADAGISMTDGQRNILIGDDAGDAVTSGQRNILIGSPAGGVLTDGQQNIVLGVFAFNSATRDTGTIAIGSGCLQNQNAGFVSGFNTCVGHFAGNTITTGQNNSIIGNGADSSSATVSNEITLGNSSITSLRCAVTSITSLSDERDKSEIKDLGYGLAFIDALQPREFVWDNRPEIDNEGEEFYSANKGKKDFGFIAQEVQELDNDTLRLVYDENPDKLELSYGKLVPILVQAIKELKAEVELLKS